MSRGRGREAGRGEAVGGVRAFVAVLLPEAVRARVHAAAVDLRRVAVPVSWVRAENLHVTLRFLGDLDEEALGRVREALEEVGTATAPFGMTLGGFGGFPAGRAPRVVWVGVTEGAETLAGLQRAVEAALARRRIPPEGRPFRAHVTVGRVRDAGGAPKLARALEGGALLGDAVPVDAVCLMRSDLDPAGARHSVLARVPLVGAAPGPRVDFTEGGS